MLIGLLFGTVGKGSTVAFWLLMPAWWLTNAAVGPAIATSGSGPENFIAVVLASSFLNVLIYAMVFFGTTKAVSLVRRVEKQT